jgi:hypothetical protein
VFSVKSWERPRMTTMKPRGSNIFATKRVVLVGAATAGVRRAMAIAFSSAERPMNMPPARPEMAREMLERPSSWRALLATCS